MVEESKENTFECDKCEKYFDSKEHLRNHIKYVHKGLEFNCKVCNKAFNQKVSIRTHMLQIHEGLRFNCEKCNKDSLIHGNNFICENECSANSHSIEWSIK